MQFEGLPERIRKAVGGAALEGLAAFDPDNDLHVDQVAGHLVRSFLRDTDGDAFRLLVDLCADKLAVAAERICDEQGLVMDPGQLIEAFFARLFVNVEARPADWERPFLGQAALRMAGEAEAWLRDFALAELPARGPDEGMPRLPGDQRANRRERRAAARSHRKQRKQRGGADGSAAVGDTYAKIVQVCFHRLPIEQRRLLRSRDVQGLDHEQIAAKFSLSVVEVRKAMAEARLALNHAIARAMHGGHHE